MTIAADLRQYLQQGRDAVVRSLDGLSDYDVRRPLTPSGTSLLGLVKHLVGVEVGYLGECVGRPAPMTLPWYEDGSVWDGADMWATPDESREHLLGLSARPGPTPTPRSPGCRSTRWPRCRGGQRSAG